MNAIVVFLFQTEPKLGHSKARYTSERSAWRVTWDFALPAVRHAAMNRLH